MFPVNIAAFIRYFTNDIIAGTYTFINFIVIEITK